MEYIKGAQQEKNDDLALLMEQQSSGGGSTSDYAIAGVDLSNYQYSSQAFVQNYYMFDYTFGLLTAEEMRGANSGERPLFELLELNYLGERYTSPQVYEKIGGKVYQNYLINPTGFENSCALRISYALNKSGALIPHLPGTGSGSDGMWYFYRVSDLSKYLNKTYGKPEVSGVDRGNYKGKQGIIWFEVSGWSNASGHFTTWNGNSVGHGDYFNPTNAILKNAHLWVFPK